MAEAYASLVSLMHIIDQIMHHGRNSFSLNQEQIESLNERAAFLVDFLERYSNGDNKQVQGLERQIADASHEAEDLIESKVVDYIQDNQSTSFDETRSNPLCQRLQEVMEVMDLMKKEAMKIKEKGDVKFQLPRDSISSSNSSSLPGKDTMVGFDDVLFQIMNRLAREQSDCQIIPISGMGGIGKTTLTRNVYGNPYIVQHFHIRAWVTISQECEIKQILMNILIDFGVLTKETAQGVNESQLGETLHKYLFHRKYLIVMDDMWSTDVWDKVRLFFPDDGEGSGIMITTRLSNMASHLGSCGIEMNFLDEEESWNLLSQKVFGQQKCSLELEEIGKMIAKNCKGLPLSIVVIAGLLAKSNMTREYWDHVGKEVNSIVSLADDEHCSKILSLSYKNLPIHLKSCFLYMGVFPEDHEISVSRLIRLWVAEGFLKPNKAKCFEEVAEEYLTYLFDRNLIMVHKQGSRGKMKSCKIHDFLGVLCLREAQKEKFICVIGGVRVDIPKALHNQRRIVVETGKKEQKDSAHFNNQGAVSLSQPRSIVCNLGWRTSLLGFRLLRIFSGPPSRLFEFRKRSILEVAFDLVNLRYLYLEIDSLISFRFPSTINLLWNLQTLFIQGIQRGTIAPPEIWEMKQLRHLYIREVSLSNPPPIDAIHGQEGSNLKNLQTLKVYNLICGEEVSRRIPNIKRLQVLYWDLTRDHEKGIDYCLSNLQHLQKLESLCLKFYESPKGNHWLENLIFPRSLEKLTLIKSHITWENMTVIGFLPNLEVLKLRNDAFIGEEWNPVEEQFISLKYLEIDNCDDLKLWNADSIHFPNLEQLFLSNMLYLEEIPMDIGEIPTLRSIRLKFCSDSIVSSTIDILNEQESQGNDGIQVQVDLPYDTQLSNLEERANLNLQVHYHGLGERFQSTQDNNEEQNIDSLVEIEMFNNILNLSFKAAYVRTIEDTTLKRYDSFGSIGFFSSSFGGVF